MLIYICALDELVECWPVYPLSWNPAVVYDLILSTRRGCVSRWMLYVVTLSNSEKPCSSLEPTIRIDSSCARIFPWLFSNTRLPICYGNVLEFL